MQRILLDVDQVICDYGFLNLVNKFLGTNYQPEMFTDYYIEDIIGSEEKIQEFYKYYLTFNEYDYAAILDNAYEVIKELNTKYEIYIFSTCVQEKMIKESGEFFKNKYNWLISTFPFLDPKKFIFTSSKNILCFDIQIDDKIENLEGPVTTKILFTAPHNTQYSDDALKIKNIIRANNWKDIEKILLGGLR